MTSSALNSLKVSHLAQNKNKNPYNDFKVLLHLAPLYNSDFISYLLPPNLFHISFTEESS